jgi:uncharacterized protein
MNILVDIGHPAHVHLFRHAAVEWMARGHKVVFAARRKDVALDLLKAYGFEYHAASSARTGLGGLGRELLEHTWSVLRLAQKLGADLLLGTSVSIGPVSKVTRARSIVFNEDDAQAVRAFAMLAYPLADTIVTPSCLPDDLGAKHVKYESYQELAYLHPSRFTPDPGVLPELGIEEGEPFFLLRFVAFKAAHDVGAAGISLPMRRQLVHELSQRGRVFISAEGDLPDEFRRYQIRIAPDRIHDAMAYATMLISDSQTMTAEAAVLGTPALRCNTFVGRLAYLEELEHRYALTYGFRPAQEERLRAKVTELLGYPDLRGEWARRRRRMLDEKIDLTAWMVDYAERFRA